MDSLKKKKGIIIISIIIAIIIFIMWLFWAFASDRLPQGKIPLKNFWPRQKGEKVTVINKTEQIISTPDLSLDSIAAPAARSVVNIISVSGSHQPAINSLAQAKNGTGVILSADGLIAANRQAIVEDASRYYILFYDGSQKEAEYLGLDNFTDLAFFKVGLSNLPAIPFNEESTCFPGEKIIAIQNDGQTYANSYVERSKKRYDESLNLSAKVLASSEKIEGLCRINPDNQDVISGIGINMKGEFIGISSGMKIDGTDHHYLIGTADIKRSMSLASENRLEKRAALGVYYLSLNRSLTLANGFDREYGAIVYSPSAKQGLAVMAGSAADLAGVRIGDIIISVNGISIDSLNPLSNLIAQYQKGDSVKLSIIRNGVEQELEAILQ